MRAIAYKGNIYGGATTLEELTNANIEEPSDGQILKYDEENEKWVNDDLSKSDVGLGNVDNTSDADKPISTAAQAALNNKANTSNIASVKTVTGNPISLTDGSETYADELVIDLDPIQDLHGYDKPWVGGAGKNLLPMTVEGIKTVNSSATWIGNSCTKNGVTFTILTDDNGNVTGINANGTATANISFAFAKLIKGYGNTFLNIGVQFSGSDSTIVLSAWIQGGSAFTGRLVNIYNSNDANLNIDSRSENCYAGVGIGNGYTIDITFKPMIRLATETDSTFAPYTNISLITGYTEVAVDRCGKNLFDKDNPITIEGYISGSTGVLTAGLANEHCLAIKLKQGNYAFSRTIPSSDTTTKRFRVAYFNSIPSVGDQGTILLNADSALTGTFTMPSDGYAVIFMFNGTSAWDARQEAFNSLQIETGSTTTYEPYNGTSLTIPLGQTVYGATVNVANGTMVVKRIFKELDGTEEGWRYDSAWMDGVYILNGVTPKGVPNSQPVPVCSHFIGNTYDPVVADRAGRIYIRNGTNNTSAIMIGQADASSSNLASFKSYLAAQYSAGTPVQVVYELATPITIPLTPAQLKLLKGYNYISSNGTTIHLTYQPDNAVGDAVSEAEKYADRIKLNPVTILDDVAVSSSSTQYTIPDISQFMMVQFVLIDCPASGVAYVRDTKTIPVSVLLHNIATYTYNHLITLLGMEPSSTDKWTECRIEMNSTTQISVRSTSGTSDDGSPRLSIIAW